MAKKCKCTPCEGTITVDAVGQDCDPADLVDGDRFNQTGITFDVTGTTGATVTDVTVINQTPAASILNTSATGAELGVSGTIVGNDIVWDADPVRVALVIEYVCDESGLPGVALVSHEMAACGSGNAEQIVNLAEGASACMACFMAEFGCSLAELVDMLTPEPWVGTKTVYRYKPVEESGLNWRWWGEEAGPHLDPLEWSGPADFNGFPLPVTAGPDDEGISNSTNVNDNSTVGAAMRYGIIDGWVWIPAAAMVRDNNTNTGELGMVLASPCCGSALAEQPGGNHNANTDGVDRTIMDPTPWAGGWHQIYSPQSDLSAFGGLDLEYSTDGGTSWVNVTVQQPTTPEVQTLELPACAPTPEGWQDAPLATCCPAMWSGGGGAGGLDEAAVVALLPVACDTVPAAIDCNAVDIRTGTAGTSDEFMRCDARPALRRLDNPGWPVPVLQGPATETTLQQRRFRSTSEELIYTWRAQITTDPDTNGWVVYAFPAIAGYQVADLDCLGVYYQTGTQDTVTFNPGYEEQYMGGNGVVWADISQIYYGHFSSIRKEEATVWWPNFRATYRKL